MSLLVLVVLLPLLIGLVCSGIGWVYTRCGVWEYLLSAGVGFYGALVGLWIGIGVGHPAFFVLALDGVDAPLLWSVLGSALLVVDLALVQGHFESDEKLASARVEVGSSR